MSLSDTWGDLPKRILSALIMLVIGAAALVLGGGYYVALIALVIAGMAWELCRMFRPEKPWVAVLVGLVSGVILLVGAFDPAWFVMEMAIIPGLICVLVAKKDRFVLAPYAVLLVLSGLGLLLLYENEGIFLVVWLIAVVVATDVAGYFAGKAIGGAKFWPSISPKKTWAGILAGWCAAGCVGQVMGGFDLALISIGMSFASQLGDIAESALKRRCGVKDSSNLIPGHGGLLDRFDGLIAANLVVLVAMLVLGLPDYPAYGP